MNPDSLPQKHGAAAGLSKTAPIASSPPPPQGAKDPVPSSALDEHSPDPPTAPPASGSSVLGSGSPSPARRPRSWSTLALSLSGLLIVVVPTISSIIYFGYLASDQYAAGGSYVVKTGGGTPQIKSGAGALAMMGLGGNLHAALPEMMVVNEYITSMQMIKDLEPLVDLRRIYSSSSIDWLERLRPSFGRTEISDEDLWEYWQKKVAVHFDMTTGLSRFEARAFTPPDAKVIADSIVKLSEQLVNRISDRAQEDSLAIARQEVDSFRNKAVVSLNELQGFQHEVKQVSPEGFVRARSEIEGSVDEQITRTQAQLDVLRKSLPDGAPGVQQLQNRLNTWQSQLEQEREKSTLPVNGLSAAEVANKFAKLKLEIDFAKEAYMSSLNSLENARIEAAKQGLYLEAFVQPQIPQRASYPRRVTAITLTFFVSLICWGILGLLVSIIREHF